MRWIALLLLALTTSAHAFIFDVNAFYFTDNFAPTGSTKTNAYTNYDIRVGFNVDRKQRFYVGWNYSGATATYTTTTSDQYTSVEMGPSILWCLNKDKTWILSFAYNLNSIATYTPAGGTAEKWKGTTMKAYLGYNLALSENAFVGPTITWYSATFSEKIVNDTTYTTDSNTRSQIYPALYFGLRY